MTYSPWRAQRIVAALAVPLVTACALSEPSPAAAKPCQGPGDAASTLRVFLAMPTPLMIEGTIRPPGLMRMTVCPPCRLTHAHPGQHVVAVSEAVAEHLADLFRGHILSWNGGGHVKPRTTPALNQGRGAAYPPA